MKKEGGQVPFGDNSIGNILRVGIVGKGASCDDVDSEIPHEHFSLKPEI